MRGVTWAMSCLILGNSLTPALLAGITESPDGALDRST